jgi:hypothetical protein
MSVFSSLSSLISTIVDKVIPNSTQNETLKLAIKKSIGEGEICEQLKLIDVALAQANSNDKWTSRARPGFLYVMYIFILAAIPMGFVDAIDPHFFKAVTTGMQSWLCGLPPLFWDVLKYGFISYVGGRSLEKIKRQ